MADAATTPQDDALLEAVAATAADATAAREKFEAAIRAAHPRWTVRQIALAAGLSPSRAHQLIQEGETT